MTNLAFAFAGHPVSLASEIDFDGWRSAARALIQANVPPHEVEWVVSTANPGNVATETPPPLTPPHKGEGGSETSPLHGDDNGAAGAESPSPLRGGVRGGGAHPSRNSQILHVPRAFIDTAQTVILHRDPDRFAFLYRLLWRLKSEPHLLHIESDPDIRKLHDMAKAIRRDIHKMRAFVRFREVDGHFLAWFEPAHYIVEHNAEFFMRRFTGIRWSILTPYRSAHWDGERLTFSAGAAKRDVPTEDATEELWLTYYRNIFNPARLKVKAMQAEMPKKYWRNLPEASLIPELIGGAEKAGREMIDRMPTMPPPHHARVQQRHWPQKPPEPGAKVANDIAGLRLQAETCRRCALCQHATQTVFGEGPENAGIMFVGEQPGDQEDIQGKPFVGPAGKVFDAAVEEAGIARDRTYVTNAVKHFKFEPRGKRRIHQKPNAGEVTACRWWLDKELKLIAPDLVVALGATAAHSLLGKAVPITRMRGQVIEREDGLRVFLTIHPSFILRIPDEREKAAERERFVADMRAVHELMSTG